MTTTLTPLASTTAADNPAVTLTHYAVTVNGTVVGKVGQHRVESVARYSGSAVGRSSHRTAWYWESEDNCGDYELRTRTEAVEGLVDLAVEVPAEQPVAEVAEPATPTSQVRHASTCDGLTFLGGNCWGQCLTPVVREEQGGAGRLWYAVLVDGAGAEVQVLCRNLDRMGARAEARAWERERRAVAQVEGDAAAAALAD